jgi:hypothetical protein
MAHEGNESHRTSGSRWVEVLARSAELPSSGTVQCIEREYLRVAERGNPDTGTGH